MSEILLGIHILITLGIVIFIILYGHKKYKELQASDQEIKSKIGSLVREINKLELAFLK